MSTLEDGLYANGDKLKDPAFAEKLAKFVAASDKGWAWAVKNPDEAAKIVLDNDATGAQTEKHQKRMMREIAKLVDIQKPLGYLVPADYDAHRVDAALVAIGAGHHQEARRRLDARGLRRLQEVLGPRQRQVTWRPSLSRLAGEGGRRAPSERGVRALRGIVRRIMFDKAGHGW